MNSRATLWAGGDADGLATGETRSTWQGRCRAVHRCGQNMLVVTNRSPFSSHTPPQVRSSLPSMVADIADVADLAGRRGREGARNEGRRSNNSRHNAVSSPSGHPHGQWSAAQPQECLLHCCAQEVEHWSRPPPPSPRRPPPPLPSPKPPPPPSPGPPSPALPPKPSPPKIVPGRRQR